MRPKIVKLTEKRLSEMYDKLLHFKLAEQHFILREKEKLNLELDNFISPFSSEQEFVELFFKVENVTNWNNIPTINLSLEKQIFEKKEDYINYFKDRYTEYEDYLFYPFKSLFHHELFLVVDFEGNIVLPKKYKVRSELNYGLLKIGTKEQFEFLYKEIELLD